MSQLVEVKGVQSIEKIVINILEGQTFDGRRPKSSNNQKQQQKQRQQQAATGTQATRKAATSSRIRSSTNSTNNNPETVRAKRCGSRRWRLPVEFRLCSRLFFLDTSKICSNWSLTFFGSFMEREQINCKIVLDILKKPPGFHTTACEPKRAQFGTDASNTTKIPREDPQSEKKRENGSGRGKKGRKIWAVRRRRVPRRGPEGRKGGAPGLLAPKGGGSKGAGPNLERVGPRRVGGAKFRAFSPSRSHCRSFSHAGGLLVVFWWCLKRQCQLCTFGLTGCRVKPRWLL